MKVEMSSSKQIASVWSPIWPGLWWWRLYKWWYYVSGGDGCVSYKDFAYRMRWLFPWIYKYGPCWWWWHLWCLFKRIDINNDGCIQWWEWLRFWSGYWWWWWWK